MISGYELVWTDYKMQKEGDYMKHLFIMLSVVFLFAVSVTVCSPADENFAIPNYILSLNYLIEANPAASSIQLINSSSISSILLIRTWCVHLFGYGSVAISIRDDSILWLSPNVTTI